MARRLLPLAALALIGCGAGGDGAAGPPAACTDTPSSVAEALRSAPARVLLADGTALSICVQRAHDDGQLQAVGSVLATVADDLARTAASDPRAAIELGYLVGAVRRGAAHTTGGAAALTRRLEQAAAAAAPGPLAVGLHAGGSAG
ncbi:MAG: hypothetical protein NVSMB51_00500 [Solirubrobacteraceae bacterium]